MPRVPEDGDALNMDDVEMIIDAIGKRQQNFPNEPARMSIMLILLNIGDRFAPVTCQEEEWSALVQDLEVPPPGQKPKCPNGHLLTKGKGMHLAWVSDPSDEEILEAAAYN